MSVEVECVEITVKLPKPFVDDLLKREWFQHYYEDLEEFVREAVRRLKHSYIETEESKREFDSFLSARGLLSKWNKAKTVTPELKLTDWLDTIT